MDLRITVTGNAAAALKKASPAVREAIRGWVRVGGQLVRASMMEVIRAKQKSFGRTGFLSNSVRVLGEASAGFSVGPTADYALFVDQPTRPHIIRPRNAKALAFPGGGGSVRLGSTQGGQRRGFRQVGGGQVSTGVVFTRIVRHPGTKGMYFIDATEERVGAPLTALLEANIKKNLQGAGL